MTVQVTLSSNQGTFQGGGGTFVLGPANISSAFASMESIPLTFSGAQFISTSSPIGSVGCLIVPPVGNLVSLTLKGITGDTGIAIGTNVFSCVSFGTPSIANAVGLTSGGAITGPVTLFFF